MSHAGGKNNRNTSLCIDEKEAPRSTCITSHSGRACRVVYYCSDGPSIPFAKLFGVTHMTGYIYIYIRHMPPSTASLKPARRRNDNFARSSNARVPHLNDLRELFIRVLRSIQTSTGYLAQLVTASRTDSRSVFSPARHHRDDGGIPSLGIRVARGIPKFRAREAHDIRSRPGLSHRAGENFRCI